MVEPVTAVLTGIALVKKSVDFIKTNIGTAQDIGDIIGHVDKALNGQQQVIKDRDKANVDHFAVENVAKEVIDAKLAQEQMDELRQMIDFRFGHGTWTGIVQERARRLQEAKAEQARIKREEREAKAEMQENLKLMGIVLLSSIAVVVVIVIGFMFG